MDKLKINDREIDLPAFFPDATRAVVKGVGSLDLKSSKVGGLVVNTYHLINDDLIDTIEAFGGIHNYMNFNGPIISDSGGFQIMSLIRNHTKNGKIKDNEIIFKLENSSKILHLGPRSCIETQLKIGSDIVMCLDDCTNPQESLFEQQISVERTIRWAEECKQVFTELTLGLDKKPLIFGIIQGGNNRELRKKCAEALIRIGFDGYAYGGWPVDAQGKFLTEMLSYVGGLMPADKPKYAMGVGMPADIRECTQMGYNMFDCVLPTRDARHRRLYCFTDTDELKFLNISSGKYKNDTLPVSETCDCVLCTNYSRGYLYHLFKIKDPLSVQLATLHNSRFYSRLMSLLKR